MVIGNITRIIVRRSLGLQEYKQTTNSSTNFSRSQISSISLTIFNFTNEFWTDILSLTKPAGCVTFTGTGTALNPKDFNCLGNFLNPPKRGDNMRISLSQCLVPSNYDLQFWGLSDIFNAQENSSDHFQSVLLFFIVFSYFFISYFITITATWHDTRLFLCL